LTTTHKQLLVFSKAHWTQTHMHAHRPVRTPDDLLQVPNLGVCAQDYKTTVFADVPGLLEGAHEGLSLGHEFLRHVSRCRALVRACFFVKSLWGP